MDNEKFEIELKKINTEAKDKIVELCLNTIPCPEILGNGFSVRFKEPHYLAGGYDKSLCLDWKVLQQITILLHKLGVYPTEGADFIPDEKKLGDFIDHFDKLFNGGIEYKYKDVWNEIKPGENIPVKETTEGSFTKKKLEELQVASGELEEKFTAMIREFEGKYNTNAVTVTVDFKLRKVKVGLLINTDKI